MPSAPPARAEPSRGAFVRLLGYARPYVALIALAMLFSLLYAGGRNVRAYLVKPLFDDVLLAAPATGGGGTPSLSAPDLRDLLSRQTPGLFGLGAGAGPAAESPAAPEAGGLPEAPGGRPGDVPAGATERPSAAGAAALPGAAAEAPSEAAGPSAGRPDPGARFWAIVAVGLAIAFLLPLASFGKDYLVEYTLGRVLVDLQRDLAAKLLVLPLRTHHAMRRGDALSRVLNDVSRAHLALRLLFGDVVQAILSVIVGIAVLLFISWQLTLVALSVAPLVLGVVAVFGRRIRRSARRRQEQMGGVTQRLMVILSGIKVIQAFGAESHEASAFTREARKLFRRSMKVVRNRVLSRSLMEGINQAVAIGILAVGTILVLRGQWGLTAGSLAAFLGVLATTYRPTKELAKGWAQLMDSLPAAERVFELLDLAPVPPDPPGAVVLERLRQGIHFEDVSFSYGREPVLRDVNLEIHRGEIVALVGPTGAGKTTLVDLLLGFHVPDRGRILVDGIDLRRIARRSLLSKVAVVTQEPFLFDGTIRENIRYGRLDATDAEIEAAARAAHVDEFADRLPEGLDTRVGESGAQLSGGQRQRVTIARALLRDPELLVLDEATSALDARSEKLVQEALEALMRGRTVVVISHRLATVRHADRIVVMEGGRVVRVGTHEELVAEPGLYRELVGLQAV